MRTITNNAKLPLPMYHALAADRYVGGGDISATRVIAPPRIVALRKFHEDEIKEDATERIWSLLGSSTHFMLQLSGEEMGEEVKVEQRLSMKVEGWEVSGQPDVYHKSIRTLYDYKVTSVWSVLFGDKPEWEKQLNIQAALHRFNGDQVDAAFIVAILRDWQVRKARMEKDYPDVAVRPISIPLWTQDEVLEYISKRVRLHQKAQADYQKSKFDPEVLPLCTPSERWYRGGGFAVVKQHIKTGEKNKKADRVFISLTDARQFIIDNPINKTTGVSGRTSKSKDKQHIVEERLGENIRCLDYCDVWFKCPFGIQLRKAQQEVALAKANQTEGDEEEGNLFGDK